MQATEKRPAVTFTTLLVVMVIALCLPITPEYLFVAENKVLPYCLAVFFVVLGRPHARSCQKVRITHQVLFECRII